VIVEYGGRRQIQTVLAQTSYLSVNDRRLHFGLGAATGASVTVRWPSGLAQILDGVQVDRILTVREGG
jgi:hypothetical protein